MFIKSIDTDYSCKVSNCFANFWFKSELEEHKKTVHKSEATNIKIEPATPKKVGSQTAEQSTSSGVLLPCENPYFEATGL